MPTNNNISPTLPREWAILPETLDVLLHQAARVARQNARTTPEHRPFFPPRRRVRTPGTAARRPWSNHLKSSVHRQNSPVWKKQNIFVAFLSMSGYNEAIPW